VLVFSPGQLTFEWVSSDLCLRCPHNSSSPAKSRERNDCTCDPGFTDISKTAAQWASAVRAFSSEKSSSGNWSSISVLGEPAVYPTSGDDGTDAAQNEAWSPELMDSGHEWLELSFAESVIVAGVELYETRYPGSCVKIMLYRNVSLDSHGVANASSEWDTVWEERKQIASAFTGARVFAPPLMPRQYSTRHVRFVFNTTGNTDRYELDAVKLITAFSCASCEAGKYKIAPGPSDCVQCAPGKYSMLPAASEATACVACPKNTYSAQNNSVCLACPTSTTSPGLSSGVEACLCNAGYTGRGGWGLLTGAATVSCTGDCGLNCSTVGTASGTISDGVGPYGGNYNCQWVIEATANPACGTPVLELDGDAGDYIEVSKSASLDVDMRSFSWAVWVKRSRTSSGPDIFLSQGDSPEQNDCTYLSIGYTDDSRFQFQAAQILETSQSFPRDRGQWVHWAGTYEVGPIDTHAGHPIQQVSIVAGNASSSGYQDGTTYAAKFDQPFALAVTPDGNSALVADLANHKIRLVCMLSGTVSTLAGGNSGYQDGNASSAQFNAPIDIAVTPDGAAALIVDRDNNRIRKIDMKTRVVTTLAGSSYAGFQNGVGEQARFNQPKGIAITHDGTRALVVDQNRIRSIDLSTGEVTVLSGPVLSGSYEGDQDGVSNSARFRNPFKICLSTDSSFALVTDQGNHKIRRVNVNDGSVTTLAGDGSAGYADGSDPQFDSPAGIAITSDGATAIISDTNNLRLRSVNLATGVAGLLAGTGEGTPLVNGAATSATFQAVYGLTITPDGSKLLIADANNVIRAVGLRGCGHKCVTKKIYRNGVQVALDYQTVGYSARGPFRIGMQAPYARGFTGRLADLMILTRVLAESEVLTIHKEFDLSNPNSLVLRFNLRSWNVAAAYVSDVSGNGNDGLIAGFVRMVNDSDVLGADCPVGSSVALTIDSFDTAPDDYLTIYSCNSSDCAFTIPVASISGTYGHHAITVEEPLCQTSIIGTYTYFQEWEGRPAFALADASKFLYSLSANSRWYIGSTLGSTTVNAYVDSSAENALNIAGTWKEYCSEAWTSSASLTLRRPTVGDNQGSTHSFAVNTVFTSPSKFMKVTFQSAGSSSGNEGFDFTWSTFGKSECEECTAGSYKESPGSEECGICPAGKFSPRSAETNSATCANCPRFSTSSSGSRNATDCLCDKGYTGIGGALLSGLPQTLRTLSIDSVVTLSPFPGLVPGQWIQSMSPTDEVLLALDSEVRRRGAQTLVDSRHADWPHVAARWPTEDQACDQRVFVQVDFGEPFFVGEISRWMHSTDGQAFCNQSVELSMERAFAGEETAVFSCGTYEECGMETGEGKTVFATLKYPVMAQYLRYYGSRSNVSASLQFAEIQVKGAWAFRTGAPRTLSKDAKILLSPITSGNWSHMTRSASSGLSGQVLLPNTDALEQGVQVLVDGRTSADSYISGFDVAETCATQVYVELDLHEPYLVTQISRWLFWATRSEFCNQAVDLSLTGEFAGEEVNIFSCLTYDECGQESQEGRAFEFPPVLARYVRVYSSRSADRSDVHFLEVRVTGTLEGPYLQPCRECEAGTYKPKMGSEPCLLCPRNTYSVETADVYETDCEQCSANSHSPMGSNVEANCTCNIGHSGPDGGECMACFAGKYKNVNGSAACIDCPAGQSTAFRCNKIVWTESSRSYSTRKQLGEGKWAKCADEGNLCTCSGAARFGYADTGSWAHKEVSGSFDCHTEFFVFDPKPGRAKVCECYLLHHHSGKLDSDVGWAPSDEEQLELCRGCQWMQIDLLEPKNLVGVASQGSSLWDFCANNGESCRCPAKTTVRFGAGKYWIETQTHLLLQDPSLEAAFFACSVSTFGKDPAPGVDKHCECASSWVSAFTVAHSMDGFVWQDIDATLHQSANKIGQGDYHRSFFPFAVQAQYVRIFALEWITSPVMRAGLLEEQDSCRAGASNCSVCGAGKYAQDTGTPFCRACAAGTYQNNAGGTTCAACEAGKYSTRTSATSELTCHFCTTFADVGTAATTCIDCSPGKYALPEKGCELEISCPLNAETQMCKPLTASNRQGHISTGPDQYENNQHMQWIIDADCHAGVFNFYIDAFDTEECCDKLRLYECATLDCSEDSRTQLLPSLAGSSVARAQPYISRNGPIIVLVDFKSDARVTGAGFAASFTVGEPCKGCPSGTYSGNSGMSACVPQFTQVCVTGSDNPLAQLGVDHPSWYEGKWARVPVLLDGTVTDGPADYQAETLCKWNLQSTCGDIVFKLDSLGIERGYDLLKIFQCEAKVFPNYVWQHCAADNQTGNGSQCICPGTARYPGKVRFGNGTNWEERDTLHAIRCDEAAFLRDPAPGASKWCECIQGGDPCQEKTELFNSDSALAEYAGGGDGIVTMNDADLALEYRSLTGVMLIEFTSDVDVNGAGFEGTWYWDENASNTGVEHAWRWTAIQPLNKLTKKFHAICAECPGGTANPLTGSTSSDDCIQCRAGTYSEFEVAAAVCANCSASANSPARSDNSTDCICNAGYTGPDGGHCPSCVRGTYKATNGSAPCVICPRNTYSTVLASDSDTCLQCPNHTSSPDGTASIAGCICNPGFTGVDVCVECVAGSYKPENGSSPCTLCPHGTYSTQSQQVSISTCLQCPNHTSAPQGSDNITRCICNVGYTGPDGVTCTACPPGFYKSVNGTAECVACSPGKFSSESALSSASDCLNCALGSYSQGGVSNCSWCEVGRYTNASGSTACRDCPAGKYGQNIITVEEPLCQTSIIGTYTYFQEWEGRPAFALADESKFLYSLPANSRWYIGSTLGSTTVNAYVDSSAENALNIAGTWKEWCSEAWTSSASLSLGRPETGMNETCLDCEAGEYADLTGLSACKQCAVGKYSLESAIECLSGEVMCTRGSHRNNGSCAAHVTCQGTCCGLTGFGQSTVRVALHASSLVAISPGRPISRWDRFSQSTPPSQPILSSYESKQSVSFNAGRSQFLDGGSTTLTFSGGLTVITRFRFTGHMNAWERIFDFGDGENDDNVYLARRDRTSTLQFQVINVDQVACELNVDNVLVQDEWMTIAVRYNAGRVDMLKNGNALVAVSGTLCQTASEGFYEYLQQWDDKPAYAKTDGSRFIYYLSSYGKWYFSDTLGSTTVNARVVSSAADVSGIAATWQEYCNNDWTDSGGLTVQRDVSCSSVPADRDVSTSYVGKSNWPLDSTANMELAGLLIIEEYLDKDDVMSAGKQLTEGGVSSVTVKGVLTHGTGNYGNFETCRWLIAVEQKDECVRAPITLTFDRLNTASTAYTEYAFEIMDTHTAGEDMGGFAELRFYDGTGKRLTPSSWSNPGGDHPASFHAPAAAFDGELGTSWLDRNKGTLIATFDAAVQVASYDYIAIVDASVHPGRNPVSWLLKARRLSSDGWEILARVVKYSVTEVDSELVGPFSLFAHSSYDSTYALISG